MKQDLRELGAILMEIWGGHKWQYCSSIPHDVWFDPVGDLDALKAIQFGYQIRLKPWTLPPPPEGREWHRTDFTEDMLSEGYRPLLLGECGHEGTEYLDNGIWIKSDCFGQETGRNQLRRRTNRPLPEPEPAPVPLGPEDVPPGSVLRPGGWAEGYVNFEAVTRNGIRMIEKEWGKHCSETGWIPWDELAADGWQIQRPGHDWQPCSKPAP